MKKRTLGIVVVLAVVAVLSLGLAGSALAAPTFSSFTPATASTSNPGNTAFTVYGNGFPAFMTVTDIQLQQKVFPFDSIWVSNIDVVNLMGGDVIYGDIQTYGETPGAYDVTVYYLSLIGQVYPDSGSVPGTFTVTGTPPTTNPTIASISPTHTSAGGAAFTLTVNGANFATGMLPAVINWNGTALPTSGSVINPTAILNATIPASYIATAGNAVISVTNPNLGGGTVSNKITFIIDAGAPTLTGLSPATTWAKFNAPPAVALSGSGFVNGATAVVNGVSRAATFVSATQLSVQLTAADIAAAGSFTIAAKNPGSSNSAALPFTVVADTTGPVATISGADANWHNAPVNLTVAATDSQSGVQNIQWGIGTVPPWTTVAGSAASITVPAPADHSGDGIKTVSAFGTDNCNNVGATVTTTVKIDTQGPTTAAMCNGSVKRGKYFQLGYRADDPLSPTCAIVLKIKKASGSVQKTFNLGQQDSNVRGNEQFKCNFAKGTYKYFVYATDLAGNVQTSIGSKTFKVK